MLINLWNETCANHKSSNCIILQDREKARLSHQESNLAFLDVFVDRPKEECERLTGLLRNGK